MLLITIHTGRDVRSVFTSKQGRGSIWQFTLIPTCSVLFTVECELLIMQHLSLASNSVLNSFINCSKSHNLEKGKWDVEQFMKEFNNELQFFRQFVDNNRDQ